LTGSTLLEALHILSVCEERGTLSNFKTLPRESINWNATLSITPAFQRMSDPHPNGATATLIRRIDSLSTFELFQMNKIIGLLADATWKGIVT
jgi:hypothetical protein